MPEDTELNPIAPELLRHPLPDGSRRDYTASRPMRPDCIFEDEGHESTEPVVQNLR